MNLQHQRIAELCQALKLERVADHYPVLAQQAVREEFSFGDFLEQLLRNEQSFRPLHRIILRTSAEIQESLQVVATQGLFLSLTFCRSPLRSAYSRDF